MSLIQKVLIYILPVLFAITAHEAAHGYVSRYFGDNTAYAMGRVTLNPLRHIDPFGTIVLPLLTLLLSPIMFGYAKPVPVSWGNLRHPKRDMVWVAMAGPVCNLLQALFWALVYTLMNAAGLDEPFFKLMAIGGVYFNFIMAAFNLFPLPPLDGGRVVTGLLPRKLAWTYARVEPYGFFIVLGLFYFGVVSRLWVWPLLELGYSTLAVVHLATPFPRF